MPDLSPFAHEGKILRVSAGHHFFTVGDIGHEMYVVTEGAVEIRLRNKLLETVRAGGIFGEMALIDHRERSADVVAATEATVAVIDEDGFKHLVRDEPAFALEVMKVMADRLRRVDELI